MLYRLDDWLIDRVAQPAADRLARWTTADALGRSLVLGGAVFNCCRVGARFQAGSLTAFDAASAGFGVAGVFLVMRAVPPPTGSGVAPAARLLLRLWRLVLLPIAAIVALFAPLSAAVGTFTAADLFLVADVAASLGGAYLMACRNNPPTRREAREPSAAFAAAGGS